MSGKIVENRAGLFGSLCLKVNQIATVSSIQFFSAFVLCIAFVIINNGNRTGWSPIRSVIIRVINKIGRHDVWLPINQNYGKIRETNKSSIER